MGLDHKLLTLRKQNKYTQEDIAEKLSVTRQTISNWENGTGVPSIQKAKELADLYHMSLDELAGTQSSQTNQSLLKKWEGKKVILTDCNGVISNARIIEVDEPWMTLLYENKQSTKTEMIRVDTLFAIKEVCE